MMPDKFPDSKLATAVLVLGLLWGACHPMPPPGSGDPRLPEAFCSPEKTFATWVKATLAGDSETVRECYWEGLGKEELRAYLSQNLRPEAKTFFKDAKLVAVVAVTRVEVNFTFRSVSAQEDMVGVMVRTRHGWKVQHW